MPLENLAFMDGGPEFLGLMELKQLKRILARITTPWPYTNSTLKDNASLPVERAYLFFLDL